MAELLFSKDVRKSHPRMWYTHVGVVCTAEQYLYVICKSKETDRWLSFTNPTRADHRIEVNRLVREMNQGIEG